MISNKKIKKHKIHLSINHINKINKIMKKQIIKNLINRKKKQKLHLLI
jgi:hypothetical protein